MLTSFLEDSTSLVLSSGNSSVWRYARSLLDKIVIAVRETLLLTRRINMSTTSIGTISRFNEKRSYGFIQQSDGPDVFAHQKEVVSGTLGEGKEVKFTITEGKKGPQAIKIVVAS